MPGQPRGRETGLRVVVLDPAHFTPYYDANLCRSLADRGLPVELVTSPYPLEAISAVGGYRIRTLFSPILGGRLGAHAGSRRTRFRRAVRMAGYSGGLWRTWRALASGGPGVLHVQWAPVPLLDALLLGAARRRGWSIVYTAHNLLPHRTPRPWDPWQYRRLYRRTDAVIVHAAVLADRLVATVGMRREQVHVVPPGGLGVFRETPLGASEARARLGLDRDAPWLLFFGLIRPYKGLADLIHAMPLVRQRFPRVRLLVAGEPMQRLAPLLRLVDRLGLRDAIVLRSGFVPMRDVAVYFCAADLVVLPYVTGSVSAILLTAYDYGRPVVTTAVGGLPELVDDGRTGFVVPPGRPAALADAVCRGLAEPQRLASMGQAARARMERCHAWDDVARQTVEVYRMARGMGGDSRPEGA